jgi:hypothetical protein
MNNIDLAIRKAIAENKDKRLSTVNIVSAVLDRFTTDEIVEYFRRDHETALRYYLEQQIAGKYMQPVSP